MAMTDEERKDKERRAYQRAYYRKNKAKIKAKNAAWRERNGIETPARFLPPTAPDNVEWESLSKKFLSGEGKYQTEEQSGIGAFEWGDEWD